MNKITQVFVALAALSFVAGCSSAAEMFVKYGGAKAKGGIEQIRGFTDKLVQERKDFNKLFINTVDEVETILQEEIPRLKRAKCEVGLLSELIEYARRSEVHRQRVKDDCQLDIQFRDSVVTVDVAPKKEEEPADAN
jgi:hypothetical protein